MTLALLIGGAAWTVVLVALCVGAIRQARRHQAAVLDLDLAGHQRLGIDWTRP